MILSTFSWELGAAGGMHTWLMGLDLLLLPPPGNHTELYIAIRNLLAQKKNMFTKIDFKNNICIRTKHVFLER